MNKTMILQVIKPNHPLYEECETLCVTSKQLYNVGLYELIQHLFNHHGFLSYQMLYQRMKQNNLDYNKIAGLDLGLNNLMTVATNQKDIHPIMVNGRPLKSINQHWNKQKAKRQSKLKKGVFNSHKISQITKKRNNKVDTYLHIASRMVVNWLIG